MQRFTAALSFMLLMGFVSSSMAGPAEDVAQLAAARGQAFEQGMVDAYAADIADNAVLTSSLSGLRIEGKAAIQAFYVELFQIYPKRHTFARQPMMRVYNDDLVVQNTYFALDLTNQKGDVSMLTLRSSTTWAKLSGRWQIVDNHVSRMMP